MKQPLQARATNSPSVAEGAGRGDSSAVRGSRKCSRYFLRGGGAAETAARSSFLCVSPVLLASLVERSVPAKQFEHLRLRSNGLSALSFRASGQRPPLAINAPFSMVSYVPVRFHSRTRTRALHKPRPFCAHVLFGEEKERW